MHESGDGDQDRGAHGSAHRWGAEERLYDVLTSTMTELEETNGHLHDYASSLAHDLRNPLASIHALAELVVQTEDLSPQGRDFLRRIVDSSAACDRMIGDVLAETEQTSRTGVGALDLAGELTWLRTVVGDPALDLRSPGPLPVVRARRNALRQVLLNLVVNALKHRGDRPGVRVEVTAEDSEQGWRVTVADDGPGIPAGLRQAALRPGERLGSAVTGTGRGLAQSRATMERAGGRLWLGDRAGGGLSVHLLLPHPPG